MKNKYLQPFLKSILFLFIYSCFHQQAIAQYKIADIINSNKSKIISPYQYDGFKMNEFQFDLLHKNIRNEFIAFKNQKYQLLFCASAFDETVTIRIYNKKDSTAVVAEKKMNATTTNWMFEPPTADTYTIVYEIAPSDTEITHGGCIVMLIGFSKK
jgi:hypothetical protein